MGNSKSIEDKILHDRNKIFYEKLYIIDSNSDKQEMLKYTLKYGNGIFNINLNSYYDDYSVIIGDTKIFDRLVVKSSEELKNKINEMTSIFIPYLKGVDIPIEIPILRMGLDIILLHEDMISVKNLIENSDSLNLSIEIELTYKYEKIKILPTILKIECYRQGILLTNDSVLEEKLPVAVAVPITNENLIDVEFIQIEK